MRRTDDTNRRWPASRILPVMFAAVWQSVFCGSAGWTQSTKSNDAVAFFRQRIQPVLESRCFECHSADAETAEGGLRVDSRLGLLQGGDIGPAVSPGKPSASLLLSALRYEDLEMPPDGPLDRSEIADFERWISGGAITSPQWLENKPEVAQLDLQEARAFWSLRPLVAPELPRIQQPHRAASAVDCFILSKLDANGLTASDPAERQVLIRRVYFDLHGLPPTPEEVDAFVSDTSASAYENLVDRLLASPRYGQRAAQAWLDVIRYAESEGFEYDRTLHGMWRFRDYVIDSFNVDKPYDRFVSEQLAGDELYDLQPAHKDQSLLIAAGFQRLGAVRRNAGNQNVASSRNEVLTERTDIVGSAFLGLTIGCARCHDHKFDPLSQRDYYSLQAFFAATKEHNVSLVDKATQQAWDQRTEQIEAEIAELKKRLDQQMGDQADATSRQIESLQSQLPEPLPMLCSIRDDLEDLEPIRLLRRGDPDLGGPPVGMRPPAVLLPDGGVEDWTEGASPRLQLAQWLSHPQHPLVARVMVNRVWQQHFGVGLVSTANDFGHNGARPSHPDLLDYLAKNFVESGMSIKSLHRAIVLSNTYRQGPSSGSRTRADKIDPDNRLLSFYPRRRLTAEELRDAMLTVSGRLNAEMGGEGVMLPVDQELIDQLYKPSQWQVSPNPAQHARRSIYLVAKRNLRMPFMEVFDQPAALTSCAVRVQSTHAPQALELLNGQMANELSSELAARLRRTCGNNARQQVELAFRLATGSPPTATQRAIALDFLEQGSLREFALAIFNLNDFLYVN